MANVREIQSRIKSIKDTMKITNAMYMISSSNLKKAKQKLADTEPYFYTLQAEITRILRHLPELEHPYFDARPQIPKAERKIGCIVVTADKGLAGAYNHNVIKMAEEMLQEEGNHQLFVLGELGRQYFSKKQVAVDTNFRYTVQKPTMHRARVISEKVMEMYRQGELDEVYIIYTRMNSAVQMEAERLRLLPLEKAVMKAQAIPLELRREEIMLSPSAESVLDSIVPNYVTGVIYGSLVESYSSEQNSRMMAMEASTKSAKDMLRELSIQYNRARQAAITQELTEVIGGAKALKRK